MPEGRFITTVATDTLIDGAQYQAPHPAYDKGVGRFLKRTQQHFLRSIGKGDLAPMGLGTGRTNMPLPVIRALSRRSLDGLYNVAKVLVPILFSHVNGRRTILSAACMNLLANCSLPMPPDMQDGRPILAGF
ncbi:hypothetical protein Hte_008468 [Hypoxylon texense]